MLWRARHLRPDGHALLRKGRRPPTDPQVTFWVDEISNEPIKPILIFVGNKADLTATRVVNAELIAERLGDQPYFECSAKTGDGCDAALNCLVENIRLLNSDLMRSQETVDLTASPKKQQKEGKGFCTLL